MPPPQDTINKYIDSGAAGGDVAMGAPRGVSEPAVASTPKQASFPAARIRFPSQKRGVHPHFCGQNQIPSGLLIWNKGASFHDAAFTLH